MREHDWSEFSDHCVECALPRTAADKLCAPSTADDAEAIADILRIAVLNGTEKETI